MVTRQLPPLSFRGEAAWTDSRAVACAATSRFTASGFPYRVGLCHCLDCRKHHGALFHASAVFPPDAVTIDGETRDYVVHPGTQATPTPSCSKRGSKRGREAGNHAYKDVVAGRHHSFGPNRLHITAGKRHERWRAEQHSNIPRTGGLGAAPSMCRAPASKVRRVGLPKGPRGVRSTSAPPSNLTLVANAIELRDKSLTTLVTVAPGLALTQPVEISIGYFSPMKSARITQSYVAANGNRFLYNDLEGDGQPRLMRLDISLREPKPAVGFYTFAFSLQANLDPLYDVAISPLLFTLLTDCDWFGDSEIKFHWYSPDDHEHTPHSFVSIQAPTARVPLDLSRGPVTK